MRVGTLDFRPRLWPTVAALVLVPGLSALGFWQLDRAKQKEVLFDRYQQHQVASPRSLAEVLNESEAVRFVSVYAEGDYDSRHQFLLDNKVHQGRVGYQVLTPMRLKNTGFGVLVNRGWVPQGSSRADLPAIGVDVDEEVRVAGLLDYPAEDVLHLGEGEDRAPGWPKVLQRVRPDLQSQQLGYELLPVLILLAPEQQHGFVRDWKPAVTGPERNQGYAVQWFAMALAVTVIFFAVNTRRVAR